MDPVDAYIGHDTSFSSTQWIMMLALAALIRLIPVLIAVSAVFKLRRFAHLRPLHILLLIAAISVSLLDLIDITALRAWVPSALRTSGVWSFLWLFCLAWLAVTWTRSAFKTRLQPRALEAATLICVATSALCLAVLLVTGS